MVKDNQQKIIVIVGPTASGKSDLGIRLAEKCGGEIISADSRQVYRGMDIGTGKVLTDRIKKLRITDSGLKRVRTNSQFVIRNSGYYSSGIRHHLIDIANPKKQFTADDFKKLGEKAIKEILAKGKVPIIVGGTGFYIDILLGRMATAQVPINKKLRAKLEKQSAEQLFKRLSILDPQRSKTIDRHNKRRLVRALEIVTATKKSSAINPQFVIRNSQYDILWLGINPGKKELERNIKKRLDARLKQGMVSEVKILHKGGVSWKRLDDFGLEYRWISRWLRATKNKEQGTRKFKDSDEYQNLLRDIIRYSKRQMTWFKRNKEIHWIKNDKTAERFARQFIYS